MINSREEYSKSVEEIKAKDDENLTLVIQQFISEINTLKGEIEELKEIQANNNSEMLEKIEKVNYEEKLAEINEKIKKIDYEEKLAEINEKIEKINYDEKLTEINNKIQDSEIKNTNNIISFEALKEKRKAGKKVFKTNENINYEDLEKLSTCVIDLNEEMSSIHVMSN